MYSRGVIDLNKIFKYPQYITDIIDSFTSQYSYSPVGSVNKIQAYFEIGNDTFSKFTNIQRFGWQIHAIMGVNNWAADITDCSFCGSGLKKVVLCENGNFPENVFENNSKLKDIAGLFMGAELDSAITPALPGNLLRPLKELERCDGLFRDVKFKYTLSESKFDSN